MSEGQANKFYEGEGESHNDATEDPSVIVYFAVKPIYEVEVPKVELLATSINAEGYEPEPTRQVHGMRLVGLIPCSDAFGVDLLVDHYTAAIKKNAQEKEQKHENLKKSPEELAGNYDYGQDIVNYSPKHAGVQYIEKKLKPIVSGTLGAKLTEADEADKRA